MLWLGLGVVLGLVLGFGLVLCRIAKLSDE